MCLFEAIRDGDIVKITTILQRKGRAAHAANRFGFTPLHYAVDSVGGGRDLANMQKIIMILAQHAGDLINTPTDTGRTPLHMAASSCQPDVVSILLEYGADAGLADRDGLQPIHMAIRYDSLDCFKLLLGRTVSGQTSEAQLVALRKYALRYKSVAILDYLTTLGIKTPRERLFDAVAHQDLAAVKKILAAHPELSVEETNDDGISLIECALMAGNSDICQFLLDTGYKNLPMDKTTDYLVMAGKTFSPGLMFDIAARRKIPRDQFLEQALDAALLDGDDELACDLLRQGAPAGFSRPRRQYQRQLAGSSAQMVDCLICDSFLIALKGRCWQAALLLLDYRQDGVPHGALALCPMLKEAKEVIITCENSVAIEAMVAGLKEAVGLEECKKALSGIFMDLLKCQNLAFLEQAMPYIVLEHTENRVYAQRRQGRVQTFNQPHFIVSRMEGGSGSQVDRPESVAITVPYKFVDVVRACLPLNDRTRKTLLLILRYNLAQSPSALQCAAISLDILENHGNEAILFLTQCGFNTLSVFARYHADPRYARLILGMLEIWQGMVNDLKKAQSATLIMAFAAQYFILQDYIVEGDNNRRAINLLDCLNQAALSAADEKIANAAKALRDSILTDHSNLRELALMRILSEQDLYDANVIEAANEIIASTAPHGQALWDFLLHFVPNRATPFYCLYAQILLDKEGG